MRTSIFLVLEMLMIASCSHAPGGLPDLPKRVGQWSLSETQHYTDTELYDYMDGGAELYRSFGFQELKVGRYTRADHGDLVAEIYRMDTEANALGIFLHDRQDSSVGIGQESEFGDGWLRFWKGTCYVSVYAEEPCAEADSAVLALGRTIDRAIRETGEQPPILSTLPRQGLLPNTVRYFHDHVSLNHYYFLARENVLSLGPQVEGTLARYRTNGASAVLCVIRYPSEQEAAQALDAFYRKYLGAEQGGGWEKLTEQKWSSGRRVGRSVLLVLECQPRSYGEGLIKQMQAKVEEGEHEGADR